MAKPQITIREHTSVFGRTGTGKTFLARQYLAGFTRVFALDTKGFLSWPEVPGTKWSGRDGEDLIDGNKEVVIIDRVKDLSKAAKSYPKVIYRPAREEMNLDYYDEFFEFCYYHKNCISWIDEAMNVCPTAYKIPEYYKGILTRGRQLNVGAWSLSQRPSGLPQLVLSESTHYFVFDLNLEVDREKLVHITGCKELINKPGVSRVRGSDIPNFWYYNANREKAKLSYLLVS